MHHIFLYSDVSLSPIFISYWNKIINFVGFVFGIKIGTCVLSMLKTKCKRFPCSLYRKLLYSSLFSFPACCNIWNCQLKIYRCFCFICAVPGTLRHAIGWNWKAEKSSPIRVPSHNDYRTMTPSDINFINLVIFRSKLINKFTNKRQKLFVFIVMIVLFGVPVCWLILHLIECVNG